MPTSGFALSTPAGPAGSDVLVETSMGIQRDPAVAARSDGGATVVWRNSSTHDVQYAVVSSAAGTTQDLIAGAASAPDIAALADGRALVVAAQVNATIDIVFRFIDAAGLATGPVQAFIDDGAGDQDLPAIAASLNTALVVYQDTAAGSADIAARLYDGTAFATETVIADTGSLFEPDVAALADGRFIVVWEEADTNDIQGRFVSPAGAPLGAVFTLSDAGGDNHHPRVAALPDGGFIVTWENTGGLSRPKSPAATVRSSRGASMQAARRRAICSWSIAATRTPSREGRRSRSIRPPARPISPGTTTMTSAPPAATPIRPASGVTPFSRPSTSSMAATATM